MSCNLYFKNILRSIVPDIWRLQRLVGSGARIFSYTTPTERMFLYGQTWTSIRIGRIVEIGSHLGASAVVLAEVLRRHPGGGENKVYCIDTWMNDAMTEGRRDTFEEFQNNTEKWKELLCPIRADSIDVKLPFDECDLVFIDGDHSYEGVKLDVEKFSPLVRTGGCMLLHDHRRQGVARVVGEVLAGGGWQIANLTRSMLSLERCQ